MLTPFRFAVLSVPVLLAVFLLGYLLQGSVSSLGISLMFNWAVVSVLWVVTFWKKAG